MQFLTAFSLLALAIPSLTSPTPGSTARSSIQTFNDKTVFQAPSSWTAPGTLYARTLELADGSLLATWENYSPEPPLVYFPIYKSTNHGQTWTPYSNVTDTTNGFGLRYQPFLYQLPADFAGFQKGDILLSGNSIPSNLSSTHIELYGSRDGGKTWSFISHIASGGRAVPDNGQTPVWEPFLLLLNNQLICFYSDQRDPAHGQKLVHQVSDDGLTWGAVVDDVAYSNYSSRPGMTTVAQLPNGQWIMTYEYGGGAVAGNPNAAYTFPIYYKVASSPLEFNGVTGQALVATDGTVPVSSPYVVATKSGKVIVSCGTDTQVFVAHANSKNGLAGAKWVKTTTGESTSYSRSLTLLESTAEEFMVIAGGGALPPSSGNKVTVGVLDIASY